MVSYRLVKQPIIKKKINKKFVFAYLLLGISFLLIALCSGIYIINYTNFIEEAKDLLSEKRTDIK